MIDLSHQILRVINRSWRKNILGQKLSGRPKGSKNKKKAERVDERVKIAIGVPPKQPKLFKAVKGRL